jgi:hypothetical protein
MARIDAKLDKIEEENEKAVKWDHRIAKIGLAIIAVSALVGISFGTIEALFRTFQGQPGGITGTELMLLVVTLTSVFVFTRNMLRAARNVRRARVRGESPRVMDLMTIFFVLMVESVSFGYMIWLFEGKPPLDAEHAVQWFFLACRAVGLPWAVLDLELSREMPVDTVDISLMAEIGQAYGVLRAMVRRAYDEHVPDILKIFMP